MSSAADVVHTEPAVAAAGTGLFVYGIVAADATVPGDLTGLDGEAVHVVPHGPVAALVTRVALERPPGRGAELLAYNSVLDAVAQGAEPVVPVRFGAILADRDAVDDLLAGDEAWFSDLLDRLTGRRQFVIQADADEEALLRDVLAAEPEIAELSAWTREQPDDAAYGERVRLGELVSRAVDARREDAASRLLEQVLPLTDAHALRPAAGLHRVLDASVLVADERRADFEAVLEAVAEQHHGRLRLRLMGPTAPYDFVEGA